MAKQPEVNQRIAEVLFEEWIIAFLRMRSTSAGPSLPKHAQQAVLDSRTDLSDKNTFNRKMAVLDSFKRFPEIE